MRSLWMLVAAFLFACMGVLVKFGAAHFTSIELVFYRSLIGVWITSILALRYRISFRTNHLKVHCWRGLSGLSSLLMFFYCITELPLATAISLSYTWPLFLALFSTIFLKEKLNRPLILAIITGFIGVIFLLRPTLEEDHIFASIMGLAAGFFAAIAYLNVKQLGNLGEPEWRIVFYFTLICTVMTGTWLLLTTFSPITQQNIFLLASLGIVATLAQLAMTHAYRTGTTLVVGSLGYSTVLFASIWGILIWDEMLPFIAWIGVGLIIIGGATSGILSYKAAPTTHNR